MSVCRCRHHAAMHHPLFGDGDADACGNCGCPDFRPAENPDTQTMNGIEEP